MDATTYIFNTERTIYKYDFIQKTADKYTKLTAAIEGLESSPG